MSKVLNEKQLEKVISENIVVRLGCNADVATYIVPVSHAYDGGNIVSALSRD